MRRFTNDEESEYANCNNYYAKADECKTNALINFEKEIF